MLVTVKTYTHLHEADIDKGFLQGLGIEAHLNNEHTIGASPLLMNAVGGVELQVEEKDYEEALRQLARGVNGEN